MSSGWEGLFKVVESSTFCTVGIKEQCFTLNRKWGFLLLLSFKANSNLCRSSWNSQQKCYPSFHCLLLQAQYVLCVCSHPPGAHSPSWCSAPFPHLPGRCQVLIPACSQPRVGVTSAQHFRVKWGQLLALGSLPACSARKCCVDVKLLLSASLSGEHMQYFTDCSFSSEELPFLSCSSGLRHPQRALGPCDPLADLRCLLLCLMLACFSFVFTLPLLCQSHKWAMNNISASFFLLYHKQTLHVVWVPILSWNSWCCKRCTWKERENGHHSLFWTGVLIHSG